MVGPLVRFPAGAKYFLIAHMSLSASNILLFIVNSPNNSFQAFFEHAQCRNAYFGDFVSKFGRKCGHLTFLKKLLKKIYSTFKRDHNAVGLKSFGGVLREEIQK